MFRRGLLHVVSLAVLGWLAFFVHACSAGRPIKERMHLGEVGAPPRVQVGLGRSLRDPSARIAVRGPYQVRGRDETLDSGDALPWTVVQVTTGVQLGDRVFKENPVTIVPEEDGTIEVEYVRDGRGNETKPTTIRYRGTLIVHGLGDGKVALVNEVDLEDYLKGVVGKEMNLSEGAEALKTQVIAARTYAVHEQRLDRLRRVKGEKFDLYDDERSQVYGGLERATGLAERLVDETRGMFLIYEARLVRTFYSSSCGGHTEPAWEVLQDETDRIAPLAGRKCEYCPRRAAHKWKEPAIISKKEIAEKCLPRELKGRPVKSIQVTKTLPGGHAVEVTITLEDSSRTVKLHAVQEFKRLVAAKLRSTLWDAIEDRGDVVAVWGRGYGHGAGLCQIGAYEMAKDGRTAAEILEYYFPGAKVQKLY